MIIELTKESLEAFTGEREEALALWNWNRLKGIYPELAIRYFDNNEKKAVDFLVVAQTRVKKYLQGVEEHSDYNKWCVAYGEICFIVNKNNIDDDPYNRSLLEEKLWPPFLAIDILVGILESSLNNPESQKFYAALEGKTWQ